MWSKPNKITLVATALFCFTFNAVVGQVVDTMPFSYEVKQFSQFIDRYNLNDASDPEKLTDSSNQLVLRKRNILRLLNLSDSILLNSKETESFVDKYTKNQINSNISISDSNWFAVADCNIIFNGQNQNLQLTLSMHGNYSTGFKWVIIGADAPFLSYRPKSDSSCFISPLNNEVNFSNLYRIFNYETSTSCYFSTGLEFNKLQYLIFCIDNKLVQIEQVNAIKYHLLQMHGYVITIEYFNRGSYNSGWLISGIYELNESEINSYKSVFLHIPPQ